MNDINDMLEFNQIIQKLKEYALTDGAKEKFSRMEPMLKEGELLAKLRDTTAARQLLDRHGNPPLASVEGIREIVDNAQLGLLLSAEDLEKVRQFTVLSMRMERYLNKDQGYDNPVASYGRGFLCLEDLREEIERCIRSGRVEDSASTELRDVRRKIIVVRENIRSKLESLLRSRKECFSESFISSRNGRDTLPVKKEYKSQIPGTVVDVSSSGATCFIEPSSVTRLKDELNQLEIIESNEERKILYQLTGDVADREGDLKVNADYIEELDYIFAKAKLSYDQKAVCPALNHERRVAIEEGRHPLLQAKECVPLTIAFGGKNRGVVITGPNTGGKTVALKTVGLLSVMAQCGLHVPCRSADICMNSSVLCDIGDGQSIAQNLSTFSAHISNVIEIVKAADEDSLVLMDELGSGTDPSEGEGIAIAILEELKERKCNFMATTHYPAVKTYANQDETVVNARMAFDKESLKPLYRLEMGEAGESCALYIAKRLGLPQKMLKRAYEAAYFGADREKQAPAKEEMQWDAWNAKQTKNGAEQQDIHAESGRPKIIKKKEPEKNAGRPGDSYEIGDSVMVYPEKEIGLVFQTVNEKGEVGVQIKKKKYWIKHKRLKLNASAKDLYPPDYDFSIVFDSVENRKARHLMGKRHVEGNEIRYDRPDK